jgi:hypothetical protein
MDERTRSGWRKNDKKIKSKVKSKANLTGLHLPVKVVWQTKPPRLLRANAGRKQREESKCQEQWLETPSPSSRINSSDCEGLKVSTC